MQKFGVVFFFFLKEVSPRCLCSPRLHLFD